MAVSLPFFLLFPAAEMNKYHRQILLPDFGLTAQVRLQRSTVAVVGAGGLGSPVLTTLCRAGIGKLIIIDSDVVAEENLHRQTLFFPDQTGMSKAACAVEHLHRMNPEVELVSVIEHLTSANAIQLLEGADLVIDGSDNFATRYAINDACVALELPWVFGSVYRNEAQVAVFNVPDANGKVATYRNLCPTQPAPGEVQACDEAGILGSLTGIVGNVMAHEALKFIARNTGLLANKVWVLNSTTFQSSIFTIV